MNRTCRLLLPLLFLGVTAAQEPPGASDLRADEAVTLYESGKYAEARVLIEEIDAAGRATGPLLYRLAYCQRVARRPETEETHPRVRLRRLKPWKHPCSIRVTRPAAAWVPDQWASQGGWDRSGEEGGRARVSPREGGRAGGATVATVHDGGGGRSIR